MPTEGNHKACCLQLGLIQTTTPFSVSSRLTARADPHSSVCVSKTGRGWIRHHCQANIAPLFYMTWYIVQLGWFLVWAQTMVFPFMSIYVVFCRWQHTYEISRRVLPTGLQSSIWCWMPECPLSMKHLCAKCGCCSKSRDRQAEPPSWHNYCPISCDGEWGARSKLLKSPSAMLCTSSKPDWFSAITIIWCCWLGFFCLLMSDMILAVLVWVLFLWLEQVWMTGILQK